MVHALSVIRPCPTLQQATCFGHMKKASRTDLCPRIRDDNVVQRNQTWFEVLTVTQMSRLVFWFVTHGPGGRYQRLKGTCSLHLQYWQAHLISLCLITLIKYHMKVIFHFVKTAEKWVSLILPMFFFPRNPNYKCSKLPRILFLLSTLRAVFKQFCMIKGTHKRCIHLRMIFHEHLVRLIWSNRHIFFTM
jgi:hypothetical protein